MIARCQWMIIFLLGSWLAAWRRLGDRWGWLGMLNAWVEWAVAALGILAVANALRRNWPRALGAALLWGMGAGYFNRLSRLPWAVRPACDRKAPRERQETAGSLSVMSANLYKYNRNVTPHIELIRRYRPDILCFQELTPTFARAIMAAVGDDYPYRDWHPQPGSYGFGVLSRIPLEAGEVWERPGVHPWLHRVRCRLPGDRLLDLYNVHLVPPTADSTLAKGMTWGFRTREAQVRLMIEEIERRDVAACIIGDWNFSDSSDAYRIACDALTDAWQSAGSGLRWSWPTRDFPFQSLAWTPRMLRLDYCFHNGRVRTTEAHVLAERTGSDHCPLLVELAME